MYEELRKRWILRQPDQAFVNRCCDELKLSALLARVIALRDLTAIEAAKCYLSSSLRSDLPSPFLMADMDAAVDRIVRAIQASESISIWGDYDVDGTTGASVLVSFLREIGVEAIFYVPHRIEEGYGLNIEGLRRLKERGVRLVVTVDSGISNFKEVAEAREIGVDIVIVDHHQPPEQLPPAIAVVNPHRSDCAFPDKGLCAAGLAFYVVIALRARLRDAGWFRASGDPDLRRHLDIVALGTIADMVPLKGVNRTLVKRGLTALGSSTRPGVIALKQIAGFAPGDVTAGQVGFQLGPRINAAGRMDAAIKVIELLTTESPEVALRIAQELDAHNRERRSDGGGGAANCPGTGRESHRAQAIFVSLERRRLASWCARHCRLPGGGEISSSNHSAGFSWRRREGIGAQHPRLSYGGGTSSLRLSPGKIRRS